MATYKCLQCGKEVGEEYSKRKVRCQYCGCRMLFKPRDVVTKVHAV